MTLKANINRNGKIVMSRQQKLEGNNKSNLKMVKDTALNSVNSLFKSSLIASILNFLKKHFLRSSFILSLLVLSHFGFFRKTCLSFSSALWEYLLEFIFRGECSDVCFFPYNNFRFRYYLCFLLLFVFKKHGFFLHSRKKRTS